MCNDGARSSKPKDRKIYERTSIVKGNAGFIPIINRNMITAIAVIAIKDIKINEEILVTYGYNYWEFYHSK